MTRTPAVRGLLAGLVLLAGSVTHSLAQSKYSPADMLHPALAPKHDDVVISMPTPDELKNCTVELVKGTATGSSGFLLKDANKKPLRRFMDSNGHGKVDVWSYYKDGVEVYREFDSTFKTGKPNNFRWLNGGGMKWGVGSVDASGKASITFWQMISAEEVGFEAFQAVAKHDYKRLKALLISDTEMQALKLSVAMSKQINGTLQNAPKKFEDLAKRVDLAKARFERVEGVVPACVLEDGSESMIVKYFSRPILYELTNKHDWIHTGEIIQVGMAWRLIDAPSEKEPSADKGPGGEAAPTMDPALQKLYDEIAELDKNQPPLGRPLDNNAAVNAYLSKRIALVNKIVQLDKPEQRETWYKQLFDNLTSMAQNTGDKTTIGSLKQLTDDVAAKMPGHNLAAYGAYRYMWTNYAIDIARENDPKKITAIQDKWLEQLSDFVKKYPRAEDTAEALHQLAIGAEFGGKDEEAKRWYSQLHTDFPEHNLAPRAKGSVARLSLPGRELTLSAPQLQDGKMFDVTQLRGKVVIVHYWASYSNTFADDFVRLKRVMDQVGQKHGVELVCVNLDDKAETARDALKGVTVQCYHLFQPPSNNTGGLSSPLAVQYGIHMLPTMFMVGRDGKVTNRALQIGDIETELKKVQ